MKKIFFSAFVLGVLSVQMLFAHVAVYDLRCEGLEEPLGIDNVLPHFSWKYSSPGHSAQTAYQVEVASAPELLAVGNADLWNSGKVESGESVMVPYGGEALPSRQLCFWRVRVTNGSGESEWSPVQRFSVGILPDDGFRGSFIGLGKGEENAVVVAKSFKCRKVGETAFLHVNSLGYHEAYVNGVKVTDEVLVPAVSQIDKRSLIVTYDITKLLRRGENTVELWIGSGWYKKKTFRAGYDGPAVRADLDVREGGAWKNLVCTDASWRGCPAGYKDTGDWRSWNFGGEEIDARVKALPSENVEVVPIEGMVATPQMCRNNIVKEIISPVSIVRMDDTLVMVDMGKVFNGQVEVRLPSLPEGHRVRVVYSDHLEKDGSAPEDEPGNDVFISSGAAEGDVFANRFNHHCFRYMFFENLPVDLRPEDVKGLRIGHNMERTGTFESSDCDLNAIHGMLSYTMDNLAFGGYMVDCAHIERLGYGGDGNASTLSLQNVFDAAPMYVNWLQAWIDAQKPDGSLPHTAPCPYKAGGGPYWCTFMVQAPWRVWMNFGDDRLVSRCYDSMKLWLEYVDEYTKDGLLDVWPNDPEFRHWYLGDWIAPKWVDVRDSQSVALVNNCALVQSYNELIQIAGHNGNEADVRDFTARRDALSKRINEVFYHPKTGTYGSGCQLDLVYPMLVGIVPDENYASVRKALMKRTATTDGGHIGSGLVGIPVVTEWATLNREVEYMYGMMKKEDSPGYLYMLRHGGTATWEYWDEDSRSYLHNCFNGAESWFFQALGGIIPLSPGYREMVIEPQVPDGMDWARVTRETPYGTVRVQWNRTDEGVKVKVRIPDGTAAIVDGRKVGGGDREYIINN